jgi:hypothetical protein
MATGTALSPAIWRRMWLAWVGFAVSAASWPTLATYYTRASGNSYAMIYPGQLVLLGGLVVTGVGLWNGCRARTAAGRPTPSPERPRAPT